MRSNLTCMVAALFFLQPLAAQYRTALPGYRYEFPHDHFSHPDFQTEWWYYTGNLKSAEGHKFGFELTFFRQAVNRDPCRNGRVSSAKTWIFFPCSTAARITPRAVPYPQVASAPALQWVRTPPLDGINVAPCFPMA